MTINFDIFEKTRGYGTKGTEVFNDKEKKYGVPSSYIITSKDKVLDTIHFQEGDPEERGVNGISEENLINILIDRYRNDESNDAIVEGFRTAMKAIKEKKAKAEVDEDA